MTAVVCEYDHEEVEIFLVVLFLKKSYKTTVVAMGWEVYFILIADEKDLPDR